jgi:hypothetical protein
MNPPDPLTFPPGPRRRILLLGRCLNVQTRSLGEIVRVWVFDKCSGQMDSGFGTDSGSSRQTAPLHLGRQTQMQGKPSFSCFVLDHAVQPQGVSTSARCFGDVVFPCGLRHLPLQNMSFTLLSLGALGIICRYCFGRGGCARPSDQTIGLSVLWSTFMRLNCIRYLAHQAVPCDPAS